MKTLACALLGLASLGTGSPAVADGAPSTSPEGAPASSSPPVEPLPKADASPVPAPVPGTAGRPVPSVPARPPSLLDPFPGTPGGPPLPESSAVVVAPRPPGNRLNLQAALSHRFGGAARDTPPRLGFALGASYARRAVPLGRALSLWGAVELFYDRHVGEDQLAPSDPMGAPATRDRPLTQTSFVLLPFLNADLGKVALWGGAGAGASLGYFHGTASDGTEADLDATALVWRAAGGVDFAFRADWAIGVRAAVTSAFWPSAPHLAPPFVATQRVFGAWADYGLQVQNRF